jgi:hypothetical protein
MEFTWGNATWQQFGAAIDRFGNALRLCPDELWHHCLWDNPSRRPEFSQFWYIAYHTLFWLDLYLFGSEEGFLPPPSLTLIEQDDNGPLPERPYTKDELLTYMAHCRQKCQTTIETLADEAAQRRWGFGWGEVSFAELLLYNLRHVQEHTAQLNLVLGQKGYVASDWVAWAGKGTN